MPAKHQIAVIGAGIAGLSAASYLASQGLQPVVYERHEKIGGLCRSFDIHNLPIDIGPHIFSKKLIEDRLGFHSDQRNFQMMNFKEKLFLSNKFYNVPMGLLKSKYGVSLGAKFFINLLQDKPVSFESLETFSIYHYGHAFTRDFLQPTLEKWSHSRLNDLSSENFMLRIPSNDLQTIWGLLTKFFQLSVLKKKQSLDYGYICLEGAQGLPELLESHKNITIHTQTQVTGFHVKENKIIAIELTNKEIRPVRSVISTIPLSKLGQLFHVDDLNTEPAEWVNRIAQLPYLDLTLVNFIVKEKSTQKHLNAPWSWVAPRQFPFYRFSELRSQYFPYIPSNIKVISFEITNELKKSDNNVLNTILSFMQTSLNINKMDILENKIIRIPDAYPCFGKTVNKTIEKYKHCHQDISKLRLKVGDHCGQAEGINFSTPFNNLYLAGRNATYSYFMALDAFDSGRKAASNTINSEFS
jgi:protoporphyrinogen oxidase